MPKPKAKVFIDGANVFYTQRHLGWSVDWQKTLRLVGEDYELTESRYYTGIKEGDDQMKGFLTHLRKLGLKTVTKPLKVILDRGGTSHFKSNCDVELAIDVILDANTFDTLILFSGDSDFAYLVKVLQKQFQKQVVVYSSRRTIAWELKLAADRYCFLEDLHKKIQK